MVSLYEHACMCVNVQKRMYVMPAKRKEKERSKRERGDREAERERQSSISSSRVVLGSVSFRKYSVPILSKCLSVQHGQALTPLLRGAAALK